jgi:hypothetical protein
MSRAGVPADDAERCLGHVIGGMQGINDRHAFSEDPPSAGVGGGWNAPPGHARRRDYSLILRGVGA